MTPSPRQRSTRLSRTSLLIPLLAISACASLVRAPQVALTAVELHSIRLSGATVRVELQVTNPNGFSLDARAVEYTLSFVEPDAVGQGGAVDDERWRPIASGRTAQGVVLEAGNSTPVVLEVPFGFREVGRAVGSLLQSGRLHYRFQGSFTVGSPVGELRIPFDRAGRLNR